MTRGFGVGALAGSFRANEVMAFAPRGRISIRSGVA